MTNGVRGEDSFIVFRVEDFGEQVAAVAAAAGVVETAAAAELVDAADPEEEDLW